ncbi:MAG: MoaD/ThiS family protein [Candidatus Thorarchaeota archaeon]
MTRIFIKLLNKGLRYSEYNKFPFQVRAKSSIRTLVDDLMKIHSNEFDVYLVDRKSKSLREDVIVIINGRIVVAMWKLKMGLISESILDTQIQDGDIVVFMIPVGGG